MFGIGMTEMIIIMVIVLIIFGAGKLPEIGGALGKGIMNFKSGIAGEEYNKKALPGNVTEKQKEAED